MNSGHVRYSVYLCDEVDSGVGIRGSEDVFLGQVMSGYHFQPKQSEKKIAKYEKKVCQIFTKFSDQLNPGKGQYLNVHRGCT